MSVTPVEAAIYVAAFFTAVTTIMVTVRKIKRWTAARVKPVVEQLKLAAIIINGREEIRLPESPEIVVAESVKGVLDRLEDFEQAQGNTIVQMGQIIRSLNAMSEEVSEVKGEVTHNHGGSIKDAVKRIEEAVHLNTNHLSRIDTRLEEGNTRFAEIEDVLANQQEADTAMWNAIEAVAKSEPPVDERSR